MSPECPISKSYRDLPEWQEAQAAYLSESGDSDERLSRRIKAAWRLREIERQWEEASRPA